MVEVTFRYDEPTRKWEVFVHGAVSAEEAKHAFNAVVATCEDVKVCMRHPTVCIDSDKWQIIPTI